MGREGLKALIAVLLCIAASCVKDKPVPLKNIAPPPGSYVYIVCEGNFGSGDATLYAYNPANDSVYGDLYAGANSQPLGDVFQSMVRMGAQFYLCVNNSNKVVAIDASSRKVTGTISLPSPRYILPVNGSRAYVSALYGNRVYGVDAASYAVTDTILLPAQNTEGMCLCDGKVYVCCWDTSDSHLYAIDAATGKMVQAIALPGFAPQEVLADKEQMLWVLAGNEPKGRAATLTRIDPSTGEVLKTFSFPAAADPVKPVFNPTKDTLYFIEANYNGGSSYNGVFRMGIHDGALPGSPFIAASGLQYFWALGIDPSTGLIYVGDPKGFVQKGSVSVYGPDGALERKFDCGTGPGHFYFDVQ